MGETIEKDGNANGCFFWGIDWGTNSSKWVCRLGDRSLFGKIHSSTLIRRENALIFPDSEDVPDVDGARIDSLKRVLIMDPLGQSFWDADRQDTHSSLGDAVCFSFCSLICAIILELKNQAVSFSQEMDINIGFSCPNWLSHHDKKFQVAFSHFRQAAEIACHIFKNKRFAELPVPGRPYPIDKWKQIVRAAKEGCEEAETQIEMQDLIHAGSLGNLRWGFLVESCGAGLPYLRQITTDIDGQAPPGLSGLGKLLVIDVGAGSTDVCYMLRSITRESEQEQLSCFPPATICDIAGNTLTDKLQQHYFAQGTELTLYEAENRKILDQNWHEFEFAENWRYGIANHVKEYVKMIPDERWLLRPVPLQVILTGGSGIVPGLENAIAEGIEKGLSERGMASHAIRLKSVQKTLQGWDFRSQSEYARRAVSIGAADENKPRLRFYSSL